MRHLVTVLCLLCALAAHAARWSQGVAPLILLGLVLEVAFRIRLIPWHGSA